MEEFLVYTKVNLIKRKTVVSSEEMNEAFSS